MDFIFTDVGADSPPEAIYRLCNARKLFSGWELLTYLAGGAFSAPLDAQLVKMALVEPPLQEPNRHALTNDWPIRSNDRGQGFWVRDRIAADLFPPS